MPLVYLPDQRRLFLWGESAPPEVSGLGAGTKTKVELVTPDGRRTIEGLSLPLLEAVTHLATAPAAAVDTLPGSVASWMLASKLAMELVARERVVPTVVEGKGHTEARWLASLSSSADSAMVTALAESMSPAAHAVPAGGELEVWAPDVLLRAFLDAVADAMLRSTRPTPSVKATAPWEERWRSALGTATPDFSVSGFAERTVLEDLERWSAPAVGARDRLRACFRLELPARDGAPFLLRFFLQSPDDPSLLVSAAEVWSTKGSSLRRFGRAFRDPQESLLEALGLATRLYAPLKASLAESKPELLELDVSGAWGFLGDGATRLGDAGFGIILPSELTANGRRRLRLRMKLGGTGKTAGVVKGAAGLGLEDLIDVNWEAIVGDNALSAKELSLLARQKAPLVQHRGVWIAVDPSELVEIQKRIGAPEQITVREAIQATLEGEVEEGSVIAVASATGSFATMMERLKSGAALPMAAPRTLQATLRPYQERGLAWLTTMGSLGLGACLADDMGLGKTIQVLAFLLARAEAAPRDRRPTLLVAPTSVVGNWEAEAKRFAPSLTIHRHYGARRGKDPARLGGVVLTSYGILRRDAALLAQVDWSTVVLDEAQNIKNASSATAKATRGLRATHRFALTGTPVENRLAELWSILEFSNPGFLGPLDRFRREIAVPIERYGDDEAATRLRSLVAPFLLRRLKSDPTIIQDLPKKLEMKMICTLTREQATLYKAAVDEELSRIEKSEGIERRGRVLALLTFLKQICNHPAQYLSEKGPLPGRSGKLARITEMLDEAISAGDKALVFTQFKEMGDRLVAHLSSELGVEIAFLHGGTPLKARETLVRRFQDEPRGPKVFVLSLKAGGTGLNLTAASHVFHYDRWWNPAVEDQATDRAYRIGQKRSVQVHKLVCAGTVEDKVDQLLEQKRALASKVVGSGERWITELDDRGLRELFSLSSDAAIGDDEEAPKRRAS